MTTSPTRGRGVLAVLLAVQLYAPMAFAAAEAEAARAPATDSLTIDLGGPIAIGALLNTFATFIEYQHRVSSHFSLIAEFSYLTSDNFRELGGGHTDLKIQLAIFCLGSAFWFWEPFHGPFISVRVEAWVAAAHAPTGVSAIGNQFDANLQPGWQWNFHPLTVIASVSVAYVTGPVRSADRTVAFPLIGFSATPHVRVGAAW
jgi:hypothetical protein